MAAERVDVLEVDTGGIENAIQRLSRAFDHLGDRGAAAAKKVQAGLESTTKGPNIAKIEAEYQRALRAADPYHAAMRRAEADMIRNVLAIERAVVAGLTTEVKAAQEIAALRKRQVMQLEEVRRAQERVNATVAAGAGVIPDAVNDNAAGWRRRNLGYQMFDVGQGLALGLNPAMVMMQQGPQIAQIYAGQGGVNMALKDTATILGGVARAFGPVGVAASVAALAIKDVQNEINATSGVTVSYKHVAVGTFQALRDVIHDSLRPAISAISPWFSAAWDGVMGGLKWITNLLINSFRAAFEDLRFLFTQFPNIVAVGIGGAANLVVSGIEQMINFVVRGIDTLSGKINEWLGMLPEWAKPAGGFSIPQIGNIELGRVDLGGTEQALKKGWEERNARIDAILSSDPMGGFFDRIRRQAIQNAIAERDEKAKGGGKSDPWRDLVKNANDQIEALRAVRDTYGMAGVEADVCRIRVDIFEIAKGEAA